MDNVAFALLTVCFSCAALCAYWAAVAQRAKKALLDAQETLDSVTGLENRFLALLKIVRNINAREAMREKRATDTPPPSTEPHGAPPDWRTHPNEALAYYSARLRNVHANLPPAYVPSGDRPADNGDASVDALAHADGHSVSAAPPTQKRRRRRRSAPQITQH